MLYFSQFVQGFLAMRSALVCFLLCSPVTTQASRNTIPRFLRTTDQFLVELYMNYLRQLPPSPQHALSCVCATNLGECSFSRIPLSCKNTAYRMYGRENASCGRLNWQIVDCSLRTHKQTVSLPYGCVCVFSNSPIWQKVSHNLGKDKRMVFLLYELEDD